MYQGQDKWERMLQDVNQHANQLQPDVKWQFKKLVLFRLLIENIIVFLLQYSGLYLSTLTLNTSPLWLATGTSCAFLFLRGQSVLPGIFLGTFWAYYLAKAPFELAFGSAVVLSLQAVFLRWFNYRYLHNPTLIFYRLNMYVKFVMFTAALTALVSIVFIYMYSLLLPPIKNSPQLWLHYWLANLNAILILSSAQITWDSYFPRSYSIREIKKTPLILCTLVALMTLSLAMSHTLMVTIVLASVNLFIIAFTGANYGWVGVISAAYISGILLAFSAFMGAAVFNTSFVSLTLPLLQLLLCMGTITGVVFAIRKDDFNEAGIK